MRDGTSNVLFSYNYYNKVSTLKVVFKQNKHQKLRYLLTLLLRRCKVMKADYPIIVIGRQYGSGGRKIGRIVAEKLGFSYYDSELLSHAAERLGMRREVFLAHDEKKPSIFRALLQGAYGIADNFHHTNLICGEKMYDEQSRLISELSHENACVFVGRTADHILRHNPELLSVFLHSPAENRAKCVINRGETEKFEEALDIIRKFDKDREEYYNFYTGTNNWGKAINYHLTLDSSIASHEEIAEIIINFAKKKFNLQN